MAEISINHNSTHVIAKKRFVDILFDILQQKEYSKLISWYDNGTSFVIWKPAVFAEKVLPIHFSHKKFASFERQTNFYRFKKMGVNDTKPTGKRLKKGQPVKFYHPHFRSCNGDKLQLVERKSCPNQGKKLASSINFLKIRNKELLESGVFKLKSLVKLEKDFLLKKRTSPVTYRGICIPLTLIRLGG